MLLASPEYTGPAELMLEDARTLREAGHEVGVAVDTRRKGNLRERVEAEGFPVEELDLCRIARPLPFLSDVRKLRARIRGGVYDTLHCRFAHDHHTALLALAGLDRSGIRLIRSCELLTNTEPGQGRGPVYAGTDAFFFPSEAHRRSLQAHHGIPDERGFLLPGRVDAQRFRPGPSRLRIELGIPADAPVLGIVSRIKPDRRHRDLLQAFARVQRELPESWLVIIGRGEGEPGLREEVAAMGLEARVRFAGYRRGEDLEDAYRALDVKAWIAPGNDGTCRAVLEAMASGCAVLGGRFGAVAETVVDGETGRLCDPDDPAEMAEAALWMLRDRERCRVLGAAGRERAIVHFGPERRAARLLEAYDALWKLAPRRASHRM